MSATENRAIVFDTYGPPTVLRLDDVPIREPKAGRLRVRVHAAGLQPFDVRVRSGAMADVFPAKSPQGLGTEFAGVVEALGDPPEDGPWQFAVGDEVLGYAKSLGTHADRVITRPDRIVAKPAEMSFEQAGVVIASGQTAMTVVGDLGVEAGQTLLVHGAAGGVGGYVVQIARARGASVIGTASSSNHDYLRSLGVTPVSYGDGLAARVREAAPDGIDLVLDTAGTEEAIASSMELVSEPTRIGTIAHPDAADRFGVRSLGTRRSIDQVTGLVSLYDQGLLRITVVEAFEVGPGHATDSVARAHEMVESGHGRGKVALTFTS